MDPILKGFSLYGYYAYACFTQNIHKRWIYEENNPFLITVIGIFCTTFIPKLLLLSSVSFGPPVILCHLFNYPPPQADDVIYEQPLRVSIKYQFANQ